MSGQRDAIRIAAWHTSLITLATHGLANVQMQILQKRHGLRGINRLARTLHAHGSNGRTAAMATRQHWPRPCHRDVAEMMEGARQSVGCAQLSSTLWIYAISLATRPRGVGIVPPKAGSNQKPFSPLSNWPNLCTTSRDVDDANARKLYPHEKLRLVGVPSSARGLPPPRSLPRKSIRPALPTAQPDDPRVDDICAREWLLVS